MPSLGTMTVFMVGRHSVAYSALADDDDETRIVAMRVYVESELVGRLEGDWRESDHAALEAAALAFIEAQGITLLDA